MYYSGNLSTLKWIDVYRGKLVHGKTWGKKLSSPFFALSFAALFCHFCLIWPTAYIGKQIYSGEYWNTWHTFCGKPSSPLVTKKTRIERMEWMQKNTYNRKFGRSFSKMLMSNVAGKHCTFLKLMMISYLFPSLLSIAQTSSLGKQIWFKGILEYLRQLCPTFEIGFGKVKKLSWD